MAGDPKDLTPEALIKKQEERVTNSITINEPDTEHEYQPIDMTLDEMKKLAFDNKARALSLVRDAFKDMQKPETSMDISELKDLVNINDSIAKSLVDTKTDEQGLHVLIQQMFQNYNGTPTATPVSTSEKKIDITEILSGEN